MINLRCKNATSILYFQINYYLFFITFYLEFQDKWFYICVMIKVNGYNAVEYDTFQGVLLDAYKRSGMTYFQLATEIKVNSTQTPANAFNNDKQTVSDEVLTSIIDTLGLQAFVAWIAGERYYYLKIKQSI